MLRGGLDRRAPELPLHPMFRLNEGSGLTNRQSAPTDVGRSNHPPSNPDRSFAQQAHTHVLTYPPGAVGSRGRSGAASRSTAPRAGQQGRLCYDEAFAWLAPW